jgi:hypothetical protein
MDSHRRWGLAVMVIAIVLFVVAALRISPLWSGPALPDGATRLTISTAAPHLMPTFGCATALLGPVRVTTEGDDMVFVTAESGEPVGIVWPSGWAAWRLDGNGELVDRDGTVVAREGDVIHDRFGGGTDDSEAFHVCGIGD